MTSERGSPNHESSDRALNGFFLEVLKDTYSAEKQVLRALGKMSKPASPKDWRSH
jgi:ferritin-like metal-binding protein YciE